jgi:transcriptional repressor NrdR
MRCPFCSCTSNRVIDSREAQGGEEIRRRRECDECQRRFTTRERLDEVLPKIVKRDERREEYDRAKLEHGIGKACVKRPISENAIQRLVDRVERRLGELGEAEVSSDRVGELVLAELTALDPLAGARFASVFRDFKTAADYDAFFASLDEAAAEREPPAR